MTSTAGSVRRTQQERRDEAEQRLLLAAARLICEQGLTGTTLAAVGERAGYSRGIVSHHFGSKAALIRRLAVTTQQGFVSGVLAAEASDDPLGRLLALLRAYLDGMRPGHQQAAEKLSARDAFNRAFVVMWGQSAAGSADLRPVFAEGDARSRTLIRDLLTAGQGSGQIRADADPSAVAAVLLGQLRGLALQVLVDPLGLDVEAFTVVVLEGARHMLEPSRAVSSRLEPS